MYLSRARTGFPVVGHGSPKRKSAHSLSVTRTTGFGGPLLHSAQSQFGGPPFSSRTMISISFSAPPESSSTFPSCENRAVESVALMMRVISSIILLSLMGPGHC